MQQFPLLTDVVIAPGTRVIIRASLNTPIEQGVVTDTSRLEAILPTLILLQKAGAKIILIGHIGRNKNETLAPVAEVLARMVPLHFVPDLFGERAQRAVAELQNGEICMLENVRRYEGEKTNDNAFAKQLAVYGDMYVCDAFADAHRAHASLVGLAQLLPTYFGLSFQHEYEGLIPALTPKEPSLFILGGAKFETKIPILKTLGLQYTDVFLGGVLLNDQLYARGYAVGKSVISGDISKDEVLDPAVPYIEPIDVTVWNGEVQRVAYCDDVHGDEYIYDIGPKTFMELRKKISEAKTILWNGPLGYYEDGYDHFTKVCAESIAVSDADSIVGGGDTLAVIHKQGLSDAFTHLSTAGGAMLVFLATGTLPVIEVVQNKYI